MAAQTKALKPRVAVSRCLLGEPVRYDGGHKAHTYLMEVLTHRWVLVPVCPEMEAGLGAPRPPIDLTATAQGLRVINPDGTDRTAALNTAIAARIAQLGPIHGFIGKAKSPSCAHGSGRLHRDGSRISTQANGLFVIALRHRWPDLPITDAEGLTKEFEARVQERWISSR